MSSDWVFVLTSLIECDTNRVFRIVRRDWTSKKQTKNKRKIVFCKNKSQRFFSSWSLPLHPQQMVNERKALLWVLHHSNSNNGTSFDHQNFILHQKLRWFFDKLYLFINIVGMHGAIWIHKGKYPIAKVTIYGVATGGGSSKERSFGSRIESSVMANRRNITSWRSLPTLAFAPNTI